MLLKTLELTVISNGILNQVIDEIIVENNLVLLNSLVYFVKVFHQREVIEFLQKVGNVRGPFLVS